MRTPPLIGCNLLNHPEASMGLAFSESQRKEFGLRGMLPPCISNMELNLARVRHQFDDIENPLDKYIYLMSLQVGRALEIRFREIRPVLISRLWLHTRINK
jgi:hypothetical protein